MDRNLDPKRKFRCFIHKKCKAAEERSQPQYDWVPEVPKRSTIFWTFSPTPKEAPDALV